MPYPQVRSVLSTSWVRQYGFAGAAKRLPPSVRARAIGAMMQWRAKEVIHEAGRNQNRCGQAEQSHISWEDVPGLENGAQWMNCHGKGVRVFPEGRPLGRVLEIKANADSRDQEAWSRAGKSEVAIRGGGVHGSPFEKD
jgi:hypothetical protein